MTGSDYEYAAYQAFMQASGLRNKTCRSYGAYIRQFISWLQAGRIKEVNAAAAELFLIDFSVQNDYRTQTYNQAYYAVRGYVRWLLKVPELELALKPKPRLARARRYLSPEMVLRVLSRVRNYRHQTLLYMMYATGLRVSEAVAVRVADVESGTNTLVVPSGKGGHGRRVPLGAGILDRLRDHWRRWRPRELFFPAHLDHPATPVAVCTIQYAMRAACADCGVMLDAGSCTHILRHSFARHQLQGGLDIRDLQQLLGHASIATTMTYLTDLNIDGHYHPRIIDLLEGLASPDASQAEVSHAPA